MNEATLDQYRLSQVEKQGAKLEASKADKEDLNQIAGEVRSLRKTLIQFMVTISGSAILFSFTVLQILAHK